MDPDSEFAAHIKEIHPYVEFTDQTHGIDFAVVNGKMDREVQFDFSPLPDKELVFYVMNNRWIEDDRALTPEEIAKYEAVWGDTAENLNLPTSGK